MDEIRYTLITDGSSDRALIPILTWVLHEKGEIDRIQPEWADLHRLPRPPQTLGDRISIAMKLYPCDLLFVHRDAEGKDPCHRYEEIRNALREAAVQGIQPPAICVVPVRMTEAWLLINEPAIRIAAGNPNGTRPLSLPHLSTIEEIRDPKALLFDILRKASGLKGRHLKAFNKAASRIRITQLIDEFSPLRELGAFQRLEENILELKQNGWSNAIGSQSASSLD